IHRIEQIRSFYFHRLADVRHRFGELFGFLFRFHERAGPEFNVEHQAIEIFRELLAHNARDDERLRWHRPRHTPQCVHLVGGWTQTASHASNGARTSETLSPTPPVDCLSIFGGAPSGYFRIRPLRIIESVRCRVSAGVMPRNRTAMAQALIW